MKKLVLATILAFSTIASAASADTLVFYSTSWFAGIVKVTDDHGTSVTKAVVPNKDTKIEVEGNWTVKAYSLYDDFLGEKSSSGNALFELRRSSFGGAELHYIGSNIR